jgi:hypothetical protein
LQQSNQNGSVVGQRREFFQFELAVLVNIVEEGVFPSVVLDNTNA